MRHYKWPKTWYRKLFVCFFSIAYATPKQKMFLRADGTEKSIASSIFQMQRCFMSSWSQFRWLWKLESNFCLTLYWVTSEMVSYRSFSPNKNSLTAQDSLCSQMLSWNLGHSVIIGNENINTALLARMLQVQQMMHVIWFPFISLFQLSKEYIVTQRGQYLNFLLLDKGITR